MSQLEPVRVELGGNVVAFVEAHVPPAAAGGEVEIASLKQTFESVTESIRDISARLVEAVKAAAPDKATLELGFDLTMENGVLVAFLVKGTGTASIKVTLEWERKGPPPPPAAGR